MNLTSESKKPTVAIIDYSLGNLYSVKQACSRAGMEAFITSSKQDILEAAAVILPGVGAFGDAMQNLHRFDLVGPLRDLVQAKKPFMGICLGVQLLMAESYEFGYHKGLNFIEGSVVRLDAPREGNRILKVPQIGWNVIHENDKGKNPGSSWKGTMLEGIPDGEYMYFVHSYIVQPQDPAVVLTKTKYGHIEFCSSLNQENIFACQFHPERSGVQGLKIYDNFALQIKRSQAGEG